MENYFHHIYCCRRCMKPQRALVPRQIRLYNPLYFPHAFFEVFQMRFNLHTVTYDTEYINFSLLSISLWFITISPCANFSTNFLLATHKETPSKPAGSFPQRKRTEQ